MCEPVTIATVAMSTASALVAAQQQNVASETSGIYADAAAANAAAAQNNTTDQIALRQTQEDVKTSDDVFKQKIEGAKARSLASLTAGESGVAGNSVNALLTDFSRQEGRFIDAAKYNNLMLDLQADNERDAAHNLAVSRTNSAASQITAEASPWATALSIGGGVLDAGVKYEGWGT